MPTHKNHGKMPPKKDMPTKGGHMMPEMHEAQHGGKKAPAKKK